MDQPWLASLRTVFGTRLREKVPLANHTSARVGGMAEAVLVAHSAEELAEMAGRLWDLGAPFRVLGSGSNVLVSDGGVSEVIILNRACRFAIRAEGDTPTLWAESGAMLNRLVRAVARAGLSGLEWAVGLPGTLGGAVYGNAGAFGGEIGRQLLEVEIFHRQQGFQRWDAAQMGYDYRTSLLKRERVEAVILSATLRLAPGDQQDIQKRMEAFNRQRKRSQPPGASMGSMFKNPPGDYAGRLIDSCGLKGMRRGDAEISPLHANFFINHGRATASDVKALIDLAQKAVAEQCGIQLELEIELIGEW